MASNDEGYEIEREEGSETRNKEVAILIAVIAVVLAINELLGQSAQMHTLEKNIEASNLWAFYQAKSIRQTILETSADELEAGLPRMADAAQLKSLQDRIAKWRADAARYESDPATSEGRKELSLRAKEAENERDAAGRKHGRHELATGAFHIGIVLASAAIITGMTLLLRGALVFAALGLFFLLAGAAA